MGSITLNGLGATMLCGAAVSKNLESLALPQKCQSRSVRDETKFKASGQQGDFHERIQ